MRKFAAIVLCKLLRFVGKLIGKGSSLPGKYALKICPDILGRVRLPQYILAVTGSNGKTSTVEMIARILRQNGKTVAVNSEGSNQIEGVTTFILSGCTLCGRVKAEILLIESDERFAQYTFRYFQPTHYVITNLYRDQLTRNGHPEWVYDAIQNSIADGTQLILNADDPLVSTFGRGRENTVWFGMQPQGEPPRFDSVYDDGVYCPVCKARMTYSHRHYNHIGVYHCDTCGFARQEPQFAVTAADLEKGEIVLDGVHTVSLALKSLYNVYNLLAAYTAASLLGVPPAESAACLQNYVLQNGRVTTFRLGKRCGTLLTSKHENSISYDQSIAVAAADKDGCDVVIIVDAISRKYFTSDVSWLYDIDFHKLGCDNVREIVLTGTYADDLDVRFSYTAIPKERIAVIPSIADAVRHLDSDRSEKIYVITCFSDKGKFLDKVEVEA